MSRLRERNAVLNTLDSCCAGVFATIRSATCLIVMGLLLQLGLGCRTAHQHRIDPSLELFEDPAPHVIALARAPDSQRVGRAIEIADFQYDPKGYVAVFDPTRLLLEEFDLQGTLVRTLLAGPPEARCDRESPPPDIPVTTPFTFRSMTRGPDRTLCVLFDDKILVLDRDDRSITVIPVEAPPGWLNRHVFRTRDGALLVSRSHRNRGIWRVVRLMPPGRVELLLHEDAGRQLPEGATFNPLNDWIPRPAEDASGNILIADQRRYKVHVYDADGDRIETLDRDEQPVPISEDDLVLRTTGEELPLTWLTDLPPDLRYLPPIVGVSTTSKGNRLVFTSFRNDWGKYRIDVYDSSWDYLGSAYEHNLLKMGAYQTGPGWIVLPDFGSLDPANRGRLSRFEAPQPPRQLLILRTAL